MTDEHLMRQWADAHLEFSSDVDRGLLRLGHFLSRRLQRRKPIDRAYAPNAHSMAHLALNATTHAALAGVLACIATAVLLTVVVALASSGAVQPAQLHSAMAASSPIVTPLILA
jgi:hypothetical protein